MIFDPHSLQEVSSATFPSRPPNGRSRHAAGPVVPFFRLIPAETSHWNVSPRSREAGLSPAWCSAPEFCRFTGYTDDGSTSPSAA
jgi:hypothetical protein